MRRSTRLALLASAMVCVAAAGCAADVEPVLDDSHAHALALEGAELAAELTLSPVREAPEPFTRLGLRFDGPEGAGLEVSTSTDGRTWSAWKPVRVHAVIREAENGYVAEHVVEGPPATHYRLRSAAVRPTFVALELLGDLPAADAPVEPGGELDAEDDGDDVSSQTSALTIGGVRVMSRAAWGARAPRCRSGRHVPNRITIHHTVTPTHDSLSPQARLRQIQAYHQNVNGWCDIGYNFLVSRDGRLWKGRGARTVGAHVTNNNTGNVGISFMGTHTSVRAHRKQINAVANLIAGLRREFGIGISRRTVKGHRQYGGTSCPGDALYGQLGTIVRRAR